MQSHDALYNDTAANVWYDTADCSIECRSDFLKTLSEIRARIVWPPLPIMRSQDTSISFTVEKLKSPKASDTVKKLVGDHSFKGIPAATDAENEPSDKQPVPV